MTLEEIVFEIGKLYLETIGLRKELAKLQAEKQASEPQPNAETPQEVEKDR